MKQDFEKISIHDVLKRSQQLAQQSKYSLPEIACAISLYILNNDGASLDEAFANIEESLKQETMKGH